MAPYTPPARRTSALSFTEGMAVFSGGNLSEPVTNTFAVGPTGKITNTGITKFGLAVIPSKGLFSGRFINPASGNSTPYKGALYQSQNAGYGYFLGTNRQSGLVFIGPKP